MGPGRMGVDGGGVSGQLTRINRLLEFPRRCAAPDLSQIVHMFGSLAQRRHEGGHRQRQQLTPGLGVTSMDAAGPNPVGHPGPRLLDQPRVSNQPLGHGDVQGTTPFGDERMCVYGSNDTADRRDRTIHASPGGDGTDCPIQLLQRPNVRASLAALSEAALRHPVTGEHLDRFAPHAEVREAGGL